QVVEGELERSEEELGHVQPVSLTCRPGATDGQFGWDFELFGSTAPAKPSLPGGLSASLLQ
ncbi:MAG: hypothetical protein JW940_34340, partial [Polyangiaceae bacterium]|nr:hypothetical protein [Polyangiaceae bacterium]